jgi:hypothetical protein
MWLSVNLLSFEISLFLWALKSYGVYKFYETMYIIETALYLIQM